MKKIVSMTWLSDEINLSIWGGTRLEFKELAIKPIFSSSLCNIHKHNKDDKLQVYLRFCGYTFHIFYNAPFSAGLKEDLIGLDTKAAEDFIKHQTLIFMLRAAEEKDHPDIKYIQRKFVALIPQLTIYEPELLLRVSKVTGYEMIMNNVSKNNLQSSGDQDHLASILLEVAYITEKKVRREIGDTINNIIHGKKLV